MFRFIPQEENFNIAATHWIDDLMNSQHPVSIQRIITRLQQPFERSTMGIEMLLYTENRWNWVWKTCLYKYHSAHDNWGKLYSIWNRCYSWYISEMFVIKVLKVCTLIAFISNTLWWCAEAKRSWLIVQIILDVAATDYVKTTVETMCLYRMCSIWTQWEQVLSTFCNLKSTSDWLNFLMWSKIVLFLKNVI